MGRGDIDPFADLRDYVAICTGIPSYTAHLDTPSHSHGIIADRQFDTEIVILARRWEIVRSHRRQWICRTQNVRVAGHIPAVVLVSGVWCVGSGPQAAPFIVAARCGVQPVANLVTIVFELLTSDGRVVRPILLCGRKLAMCVIGVNPVGSVLECYPLALI